MSALPDWNTASATTACTNAVVAICALLVVFAGVGAVGTPDSAAPSAFAFLVYSSSSNEPTVDPVMPLTVFPISFAPVEAASASISAFSFGATTSLTSLSNDACKSAADICGLTGRLATSLFG